VMQCATVEAAADSASRDKSLRPSRRLVRPPRVRGYAAARDDTDARGVISPQGRLRKMSTGPPMMKRDLHELDGWTQRFERACQAPTALQPVASRNDVLEQYRDTPIESLLLAQDLGMDFERHGGPDLIVATCIDPRINLRVQSGRAYVIRTAGVNLKAEAVFQFAYLTAVIGIRHIALVAHDDCAMVGLRDKRQEFVECLGRRPGRDEVSAGMFFDRYADFWNVPDAVAVIRSHAQEIHHRCGEDVVVAPLLYTVEDDRLLQIE